jgi:hypothetical protein
MAPSGKQGCVVSFHPHHDGKDASDMAEAQLAEPPHDAELFKYWEGRVYSLEERVHVLESKADDKRLQLYKQVNRAMDRAETLDLRQDIFADNLVEVREMVKEINGRLKVHDKRFEGIENTQAAHGAMLAQHGEMLALHGEMLRQILERLPSPN